MSTYEQAAAAPPPPKTLGVGWLLLGIVFAIFVVPAFGGIGYVVAGDPESDVAGVVAQAIFAAGLFAVPFFILRIERIEPAARRLGLRPFKLASAIGWMFAAYGIFIACATILGLFVSTDSEQQVLQDLGKEKDTAVIVAQGILVVGMAPIAEELFFRGFIFGGLRGRLTFWPAALISGVFFGAIHILGGSLVAVVLLSVLGVLLAWLYERTGSLGPPMLLHGIQNAIAFSITVS